MKIDNYFAELKRRNVYKIGSRVPAVQWLMFVLIKKHLLRPESSTPKEVHYLPAKE
jgi:hypothetical protein